MLAGAFISFFQLLLFLFILKLSYGSELNNFSPSLSFLVLISSSSIILGLLLSAISESADGVMSILPIALLAQIILSGIITPLQSKATEFFSFLTLGRWGIERLLRIQDMDSNTLMKVLNNYLCTDKVNGYFNSFSANMSLVIFLDIVMIVFIFYALKRMGKNTN